MSVITWMTPVRYLLTIGFKKYRRRYICIKGESNPRRVDGNDPGYHYPINA